MPSPAAIREQRLRKTKAQLIDEIEALEQRLTAVEATSRSGPPIRIKARDRYLANQELTDLARFPSENPNPVLRVTPEGTVLYANAAAIAVNGLLEGRKKPMLTRDLAAVCAEASRSAEIQEAEFESSDRVFAFSITPLADEIYINIYGRDVSDDHSTRRALEAANKASVAAEARLKAIIDNSPATICLKDAEGRYQLVNKHFTELYGMTADAMLGKTVHELFPKESADPSRAHDRRVLRTGIPEEREQVVTTPGGRRIFNEIKFPIAANGEQNTVNAIGLIATDITERKRTEEAMRESQQLLATILDNMPAMVYLRDAKGRFKLVNRKYEEVHDVDNEKIRGKTLHEVFAKRRAEEYAGLDAEVLEHHRIREGEETHWVGEEERTHAVMKFPILDTADDIVGVGGIDVDISDRKRTEKALTEKEIQLRIALDNMPGGIVHVDRDLNYVLFNAQYSQLCDFPDGLLEVGGSIRNHLRHQAERGDFGPGEKDELVEEVLAVYRRGNAASWERTIASSGRTIEVHVAPTPEGGYVSILTDITDMVESRRAAKLLQEAIDNFSDMLILYDKNERVVFTNDRYHEIYPNSPPKDEITNFTMEGLLRRSLETGQIAHPLAKSDPDAWIQEASANRRNIAGGAGETEHESGRTYMFRHRRTTEGGMILTQTDITELKRKEAALRESEARMGMILKNSPIGVAIVSRVSKKRLYCNPRLVEMDGADSADHLMSLDITDSYIDPTDLDRIRSAIKDQGFVSDVEVQRKRLDGTTWWCLLNANAVKYEGDDANINWISDITERKRAEEELREAREVALEASKAKSSFLANMSHELRTPLNAIIGIAEMLLEETEESGDEEQAEPMRRISRAGKHLLELINEILDISKIEAGRTELHLQDFKLASLLDEVMTTARPLAEAGGNRLTLTGAEASGTVHADPTRLRQVILNLLSNACKFTKDGAVDVTVRQTEVSGREGITISVKDSGIGIAPEQIYRLFEPFNQAETSTSAQYGGTGLGLTISREFCRLMGGGIEVQSELGTGSTFVVRLPRIVEPLAPPTDG